MPTEPITGTRTVYIDGRTAYLRVTRTLAAALVLIGAAMLGIVLLGFRALATVRDWRPLVYRIDEKHHAIAERYDAAAERWNETDARQELEDFVSYYYTRDRTIIDSKKFGFPRSLWFLSKPLQDKVNREMGIVHLGGCAQGAGDSCTVATYLGDHDAPDVKIDVAKWSVDSFRSVGQFRATVTFWQHLTWPSGEPAKSVLCTLVVTAEFMRHVPNDYLPSDRNPRGLIIDSMELKTGYAE